MPVSIMYLGLIGAPTLPAERPCAATSVYHLTVAQIGTAPAGQARVIDKSGTRISGGVSITLKGTAVPVSVTFQGAIDPTGGRVNGDASTADGIYTGAFHGRLYGPMGVTIGLIFELVDGSGNDASGISTGRAG